MSVLLLRPDDGVICLRFIGPGVNLTSISWVKKASSSFSTTSCKFRVLFFQARDNITIHCMKPSNQDTTFLLVHFSFNVSFNSIYTLTLNGTYMYHFLYITKNLVFIMGKECVFWEFEAEILRCFYKVKWWTTYLNVLSPSNSAQT